MPNNLLSIREVDPGNAGVPGDLGQTTESSVWSFDGRIGRFSFWTRGLGWAGANFAAAWFVLSVTNGGESRGVLAIIMNVVWAIGAVWFALATEVKRWHDLDKSGWMVLINLTIVGAPVVSIILTFVRGTTGPNRFGADPLLPPLSPRIS